jgi:predicted acylesterase/phospholipase RssA/CRP-like cAMP-binding protein
VVTAVTSEPDVVDVLRGVPLFADLDADELQAVARRCSERRYDKGDTLWTAGAEGDDFLIIASGEVTVWGTRDDGGGEILARLGRGQCVGEMALLLDEPRSATVTCSRAARMLALTKSDFQAVVRNDARTLSRISQVLCRRMANVARRRPSAVGCLVVGVVARPGIRGASLVAAGVAAVIGDVLERPVPLVRVDRDGASPEEPARPDGPTRALSPHVPVIGLAAGASLDASSLTRSLERLTAELVAAPVVIVDLPSAADVAGASAACDVVIELARNEDPVPIALGGTRLHRVVNLYGGASPVIPVTRCDPFVLPVDPVLEGAAPERQVHHLLSDRRAPASIVMRRLGRKVLGITVGVALGGGAAFGIAHIGVLQALADAGIEVDLAAGASMGSIVAIGYAAGLSPDEMRDITGRLANVRTTLSILDPTLAGTGLLAGRRMVSILGPMLPEKVQTFEELVRPCQVLATDIESGERVRLCQGRLDAAVRTSSAIPVIFTPVRSDDRTLVDGALVDPVPADILHEMGADVTVAVNVVPQLQRGVSTAISRVFRRLKRLNPLAARNADIDAPHIVDVLMNTLQIIEYELGTFTSLCADVRVTVDLADFTWIEFYRGLEIIERGRAAGEQAVPELQAALDRRVATYLGTAS